MPDKTVIKNLFSGLQKKLSGDLSLSVALENNEAKGDNSENSWRTMLSKNLPARYKVSAGFVIDCEGNVSDAIDVIIYDNYYSPYVFNNNGVLYVPAESVYAIVECKQELTKEYVEYSSGKAASVRKLKRTSLPIRQMNGTMATKADFAILAGVLTTRSSWQPAFGKPFKDAIAKAAVTSPLNFGCVLDSGSFRADESTGQMEISSASESLITFYINLITDLQSLGNVPAIDLKEYYS